MIQLDDFETLKRKAESLRRRRDQAAGGAKQLLARMQAEFGTKDVKALRKLLRKYQRDEVAAAQRYATEKKRVETEFKDVLEDA